MYQNIETVFKKFRVMTYMSPRKIEHDTINKPTGVDERNKRYTSLPLPFAPYNPYAFLHIDLNTLCKVLARKLCFKNLELL